MLRSFARQNAVVPYSKMMETTAALLGAETFALCKWQLLILSAYHHRTYLICAGSRFRCGFLIVFFSAPKAALENLLFLFYFYHIFRLSIDSRFAIVGAHVQIQSEQTSSWSHVAKYYSFCCSFRSRSSIAAAFCIVGCYCNLYPTAPSMRGKVGVKRPALSDSGLFRCKYRLISPVLGHFLLF